jgi:hypothetical protein
MPVLIAVNSVIPEPIRDKWWALLNAVFDLPDPLNGEIS